MIGQDMQDEKKTKAQLIKELQEARKRIEEQEEAEQNLDTSFMASLDLISLLDISTLTFLKINPTFQKFLGFSDVELQGKSLLDFIHPEDVASTAEAIGGRLQSGAGAFLIENRCRTSKGDYRWLEWNTHRVPKKGAAIAAARDITDRKEAKKALEKSNKELRFRLESSRAILEGGDFAAVARRIFNAAREMTGAQSGYVALLSADGEENELLFLEAGGLPCSVDPYLPMPVRGLRGEAYKSGEVVCDNDFMNGPWVEFMPAGHVVLNNVLFAPLNIEGRTVGIMGLANKPTDFTEEDRQTAAAFGQLAAIALKNSRGLEALRASEQRHRDYIANAPYGVFVVDERGRFLQVNPTACRITGYTEQELLSRSIPDLYFPDEVEKGWQHFQRMNQEGSARGELPFRHQTGERRWWSISAVKLSETLFLGFASEITHQKQAEERIGRMAEMLDFAPNSITVHDQQGNFLYANQKTLELHQFTAEEFAAINLHDLDVPESEALIEERIRTVIQQGETTFEVGHYRKDGSIVPLEVTVKQIIWQDRPALLSIGRDISERKRAEEALRESEEKYRSLYNQFVAGIYLHDLEGRILDVNPTACRQSGYTREELLQLTVFDLHPDTFNQEEITREWNAWPPGQRFIIETTHRRKDGSEFQSEISTGVVRQGDIKYMLAVVNDVSARKAAEEALRQNEAQFRGFAENLADVLFITDENGIIEYISPASEKIFAYKPSEMLGQPFMDYLPDEQIPIALDRFAHTLSSGERTVDLELMMKRKDGTVFSGELSASILLKGGSISGTLGIIRDITERKRAEEALQESEARYRSIVETTSEWIWEMNRAGQHTYSNQAIAAVLGYPPDELIGDEVLSFIHPEDRIEIEQQLPQLIENKKGWKGWTIRWRHRDGSYRFLESNAKPILDAAGELIGYRGADRDITERKAAEEALHRQLRFEKGIASSSSRLMKGADPRQSVAEALSCLLDAAEVARVYLFENFEDAADGLCMRQLNEVCAPDVHPEIDNPELQHIPYRDGFDRWRDLLAAGRPVLGHVEDFPAAERAILEPQGIVSILVLPFAIGGRWAGFIGFDETRTRRSWREEEVMLLGASTDLIGSYLARSRAEKALRDSEARYKGLVEQSPLSIQVIDAEGKTLQVNRAFEELWGLTFDDFRNFNMFQDRQIKESGIQTYIERAFAGESVIIPPIDFAAEKSVGKGRRRWVQARIFPVRDEAGKIAAVTLMHEDLTEHKQTQEALMWTQFAMDRARDSVLWVGNEGQIIYANDSACNSMRFSREELLSLTVFDIDPDFPREGWEQHKLTMREKGSMIFESRHRAKDGRTFPVEVTSNYFEVNGQFCACAFDRDITERKNVEAALRESEKRFRLLVQNSNDIIMILDRNGIPSYISGQMARILGYAPEELIGVSNFPGLHPDDLHIIRDVMNKSLDMPGEVLKAEYRYRHKNGQWVSLEAVGCNLLDDPSVHGIVLNVRDITERNKAEQERLKLQEQLQQAMKMEAVGRLAGGVAHDFNNLLTGIGGNVQLALMDLKANDPLAETLVEISKASDSAAALTRQLLAFSRKQLIEPKVLDLNDVIWSMHKMLKRLIGEDIELKTLPAKNLGAVRIDPGQFEQILVNLAVNARDAMPNGGKLTIETANVELGEEYGRTHSYPQAGLHVMLAISDTGQGMNEHIKAHLFEPFFTTKEKGKGTGLGLATIYGAVKQANGHIEVYSEEGKGTTFKIYLPRVEEKAEKLEQDARAVKMPGGNETILLVEDEQIVRNLASKILKRLGYEVLAADSGGNALVLAEKQTAPIHLLLTDVVMPGMNGRQLAERLEKIHPETRVLYSSGYTENAIAHHGVIDKGLDFIGKPYAPRALAEAVRKVLDRPPDAKTPASQ